MNHSEFDVRKRRKIVINILQYVSSFLSDDGHSLGWRRKKNNSLMVQARPLASYIVCDCDCLFSAIASFMFTTCR